MKMKINKEKLQRLIISTGKPCTEIAADAGLGNAFFSQKNLWTTGKVQVKTLPRLAKALGVESAELLA